MASNDLASAVVSMRPFVPARNFQESQDFYRTLGFEVMHLGEQIALIKLANERGEFSFLLQDFYTQALAENLMLQLMVEDLDTWWHHIETLDLPSEFGVTPPRPPTMQIWGMRIAYLWDPSGVLWHIVA
ncbi:glyoxalase [Acuticoccus sp. M5D2P5]|uniref:glyoxalase n=1 Tax=Acuticoccus kalidii TaxID=2910977 RepID=UPI001F2D81D9|nr:glyoxalase [Acuticoccus kalidii]MCF3935390.1 glyoxalase [Acuticoccus kalidii]